jgi:hypothetical protein
MATSVTPTTTDLALRTPLRRGDSGGAVKEFQQALNRRAEPLFYPPLVTDGVLGPSTRFAYEAIGYALGLTQQTLAAPAIGAGAQRVVADPRLRAANQLHRARRRGVTLHQHTVAFDGTPTFWGLAKPLLRAREHGWNGTLTSSDRRPGVAEHFGKRSQAALFDCFEQSKALGGRCPAACGGNCNPANPPGQSSHECRSDGSKFGTRGVGAPLEWWELGLDVTDSDRLLAVLEQLGYGVRRTYPGSPREHHHVNFTRSPGRVKPVAGPHARHG